VPEETAQAAPETPVPEETAQAAPETPVPEGVAESAPETPVPEGIAESAPETPVPEETAQAAPEPTVPEMPAPLTPAATGSPITCVNVMQVLVDENAEKYVKMFGLCECPHCMADVKALALNNLQPKYVVMENGHVVPRISVYEGRYQAAVTAQILRACTTVMEQPRHQRPL
jgi:competence protein ComFB